VRELAIEEDDLILYNRHNHVLIDIYYKTPTKQGTTECILAMPQLLTTLAEAAAACY